MKIVSNRGVLFNNSAVSSKDKTTSADNPVTWSWRIAYNRYNRISNQNLNRSWTPLFYFIFHFIAAPHLHFYYRLLITEIGKILVSKHDTYLFRTMTCNLCLLHSVHAVAADCAHRAYTNWRNLHLPSASDNFRSQSLTSRTQIIQQLLAVRIWYYLVGYNKMQ